MDNNNLVNNSNGSVGNPPVNSIPPSSPTTALPLPPSNNPVSPITPSPNNPTPPPNEPIQPINPAQPSSDPIPSAGSAQPSNGPASPIISPAQPSINSTSTDTMSSMAPSIVSETKPAKKVNAKIIAIIVAILVAIGVGVAVFFLIIHPNKAITTADFEKIMSGMDGYTKTDSPTFTSSSLDDTLTTYIKGGDKSAYGVVMFEEFKSEEVLKNLASQMAEMQLDEDAFSDFDWSKNSNEMSECSNKKPYVCTYVIKRSNTLLWLVFGGESTDTIKTEANKVRNAMGY